jgi:ATP-dependent Clp protease ATP-binding subunit ClpA
MPRLRAAFDAVVSRCSVEPERHVVLIRGRTGSGRDGALRTLLGTLGCVALKKTVLELRQAADPLEPELSGAAAIWDVRGSDPGPDDYDIARRWLARSSTVAVALLDRHLDAPDVPDRLPLFLDLDPVGHDEKVLCWHAAIDASEVGSALETADRHAASERLARRNPAGIGLAVRASNLASPGTANADAVVKSIERRLHDLVQPSATRGIIVERPETRLSHVVASDVAMQALERFRFLCEEAPLIQGAGRSGANALFAGPSGTGKTMAARGLARELDRPLYRVDLASLTSKWLGETEKNLRDAMTAAEHAGAVLLFDEGDALFGKRGDVVKGTDRYANLEVSYLLQAIETYTGITIVTTNLRKNIDEAFERRFDVIIEFTPPGRRERAQIWRQELGGSGDAIADVVLDDISRRAELHGGSIASAARVAKVLARHRGDERVTNEDLRAALQGEYLKIGSTVQAANWGDRTAAPVRGRLR